MKNNKLSTTKIAIIGFFSFLSVILFLTIIINLYWSGLGKDHSRSIILPLTNNIEEFKDYATLYIALLSFGASLFAGLAVFLVFSHWREQKQYELEKQYAEQILNITNTIDIIINKRFYSYIPLTEINKYVIYLNEVVNQDSLDLTQNLYELSAYYKTLQQLSTQKIDESFFKNYEDFTLLIARSLNRVQEEYLQYYQQLDNQHKSTDKKIVKINIINYPNTELYITSKFKLKKKYEDIFIIEINHSYNGVFTPYKYSHTEFKQLYQTKFEEFTSELVKKIKP